MRSKLTEGQKIGLIIAMIATSIAAYNLWLILPLNIFYKGMAVTFFLSAVLIRADSTQNTAYRYLCDLWMWLTINNVIDEFCFDPRKVEWNEYVFGIVVITHAIYKIISNGQIKRRAN